MQIIEITNIIIGVLWRLLGIGVLALILVIVFVFLKAAVLWLKDHYND